MLECYLAMRARDDSRETLVSNQRRTNNSFEKLRQQQPAYKEEYKAKKEEEKSQLKTTKGSNKRKKESKENKSPKLFKGMSHNGRVAIQYQLTCPCVCGSPQEAAWKEKNVVVSEIMSTLKIPKASRSSQLTQLLGDILDSHQGK